MTTFATPTATSWALVDGGRPGCSHGQAFSEGAQLGAGCGGHGSSVLHPN